MKRSVLCKIGAFALAMTILAGIIPRQLTAAAEEGSNKKNGKVVWKTEEPDEDHNWIIDGKKYDLGRDENIINWNYDETNKTLTISGRGWTGSYFNHGLLDSDGKDSAMPWYESQFEAKHIVIEEGITAIGVHNFSTFLAVETIDIPDTVEWISKDTFWSSHLAEDGKRYPIIYGMPGSFAELYAYAFNYNFVPKEEKELPGDLNESNGLDVNDALLILQMLADKIDRYDYSGDANGDGRLSVNDALYILLKLADKL